MNSIELKFKLFKEQKVIESKQEVTYLKNSFLHDVVNQISDSLVEELAVNDEKSDIDYPDWLNYPSDLTKQVLVEFNFSTDELNEEAIKKLIEEYASKFVENNPKLVVYQIFTLSDPVLGKIQLCFNFFVEFGYLNKSFFALSLAEAIDKQKDSRNLSIVEWKKKELSELQSLVQEFNPNNKMQQIEENKTNQVDEELIMPIFKNQKISLSQLELNIDDLVGEINEIKAEKQVDVSETYGTNQKESKADAQQLENSNLQVLRLEELTSKLERKLVKCEAEKIKAEKISATKINQQDYFKAEASQTLLASQEKNNQLSREVKQLETEKLNSEHRLKKQIEQLKIQEKDLKDQNAKLTRDLEEKENLLVDLKDKNKLIKQKMNLKGPLKLNKSYRLLPVDDSIDLVNFTSDKNSILDELNEPDIEDMTKKKISSKKYKELTKTVGYLEHTWGIYQTKLKHLPLDKKAEMIELDVLLEYIDEAAIETFIFSHELAEIKDQVMVKNSVLLGRSMVIINNFDLQSLQLMEKQYYLLGEAIKEMGKL